MRNYPAAFLALLVSTLSSLAQVEVEVVLDQDKFLPAEQFMAGVRIVNRSGQKLHLGEDADWAQFTIERVGGGAVHLDKQPPVQGGFDLESTERATVKVDLQPCFDLRFQGRYKIRAAVKIKEWNQAVISKPVEFEVVEGTKLWEQEFGVPPASGSAQPPEMRKYALQQANYLKNQLRLYLRVSGADNRVIKLVNVGQMISFGRPEPMVDPQSRLHLIYQNSAKSSVYIIVNPDGEISTRQTFEYTEARPRLRLDESGKIEVIGGARKLMADDIPPLIKPSDDAKETKP